MGKAEDVLRHAFRRTVGFPHNVVGASDRGRGAEGFVGGARRPRASETGRWPGGLEGSGLEWTVGYTHHRCMGGEKSEVG